MRAALRPLSRPRLLPTHLHLTHCPQRLPPFQPYRHFWGYGKDSPTATPTTPGLAPIQRLVGSLTMHEGRPPTDAVLLVAFRQLTASWANHPILDEHVHGLARTFEYLRTRGASIPVPDLRAALVALKRGGSAHIAGLARLLFNGIAASEGGAGGEDVVLFVKILCYSGSSAEAVEVVRRHGGILEEGGKRVVWERVLKGFVKEGDEETVLQTWELMKGLGVEMGPKQYHPIVRFYCGKGEAENAKAWYGRILGEGLAPALQTSEELLRMCVEKGDTEYGLEILDTIQAGRRKDATRDTLELANISKEAWDVLVKWTAVLRGVKAADKLLGTTARITEKVNSRPEPDINTINGLLRFAVWRKDIEMLDHYLGFALRRGIEPNRTTLELQLESRLAANDIEGARIAFEELRREAIPKNYAAREVQKLLTALCNVPSPNLEHIRQVYADLNDWSVPLDVTTLTPLLNVFLTKCLFQDVINLLNRDCHSYSAKDRRKVIHEIGEYIGHSTTSIEAAWDSYQLLYQFFPELSVRQRTDLMRLFFELQRSDMATIIFQHMRGTPGRRPDKYTYSLALTGVAYSRDIEALKTVHNALKLDQFVDPDTMLTNTLMAAYTHCRIPDRALRFWEDVKKSREGPDYASIGIALDACGMLMYGGIGRARIIWGQIRAMGVKPSLNNYCSYVEALAGKGHWDEVMTVVKEMETLDGVRPDLKLLGTAYVTLEGDKKAELKDWAQDLYPAEWEEIENRLAALPEDASKEEMLEKVGSGQLQRLAEQSKNVMLALEEGERLKANVPRISLG